MTQSSFRFRAPLWIVLFILWMLIEVPKRSVAEPTTELVIPVVGIARQCEAEYEWVLFAGGIFVHRTDRLQAGRRDLEHFGLHA